ncbi:ligand-binding protein SH3 [Candidatus Peregrinibacteria bacterium]|nr:ligand-binding protein SH3 [Candidatus Peregrinibacteria bacterium]
MQYLPPELIVFLASMLPLTEINGSIPLGSYLGLSLTSSFFWSLLGNMLIALIGLKLIHPVMNMIIKKIGFLDKHFEKKFKKLHHKHSTKFNELGALFLAIFVFLPLPGSGTYTGVLLAYLFLIPFPHALGAIFVGNLFKALILTGGVNLFINIPFLS